MGSGQCISLIVMQVKIIGIETSRRPRHEHTISHLLVDEKRATSTMAFLIIVLLDMFPRSYVRNPRLPIRVLLCAPLQGGLVPCGRRHVPHRSLLRSPLR